MVLRAVDPLQPVKLFLPTARLAVALARAVFADEFFLPGDEFLLLLVLLATACLALLAHRQMPGVWRRVVFQAAKREIHGARRHPVKEVAVVGDNQAGAVPSSQELLEPFQHLKVKVVRRLVEQEQVRVSEKRLGEGHTRLLATAEPRDRIVELVLREAEALQDFVRAMLDVVATGRLEVDAEAVIFLHQGVEIVVGVRHPVLDLAHALLHLEDVRKCETSLLTKRVVAGEPGFLRQVCDPQAGRGDDLTIVRVLDAGDDAEYGRLAGAVDADESNVLAFLDLERDAREDLVRNVGLGEVGNGQDAKWWHDWSSGVVGEQA